MTNGWSFVALLLWGFAAATIFAGLCQTPVTVQRRLLPFVQRRYDGSGQRPLAGMFNVWFLWLLNRMMGSTNTQKTLQARLTQAGLPYQPVTFRKAQAVAGFGALVVAAAIAVVLRLPSVVLFGCVVGLPAVAVWSVEQALTVARRRRKDLVVRELPLVVEQLAELLKNGMGLAQACTHMSVHARSVVASDLGRVAREIAHGVRDEVALQAFAERHDVASIHRIVAVLDAHRHAPDLGGLLAEEVRELRFAAHRELLALMQQREQQVWIPVTVATLVPGVLLLGVPFVYTLGVVLA